MCYFHVIYNINKKTWKHNSEEWIEKYEPMHKKSKAKKCEKSLYEYV